MSNILGLNIMNQPSRAALDPVLQKLDPAFCLVFVTLQNAAYAADLARAYPGIKWVVSPWWESQGKRDSFGAFQESATDREAGQVYFNPDRAWENWLNIDGGLMRQFHDALRGLPNVWMSGHNEVGVGPEYIDWEKQRTALTKYHYGLKSCVINDGVGKSNFEQFQLFQQQGLYHVLRDNGGALGYHAYAGDFLELWHGEAQAVGQDGEARPLAKHPKEFMNKLPVYEAARFNDRAGGDLSSWLAFRILRDHHYINETGGGDIPIFITEFGYDDAGRQSLSPYYSNTYTPRGLVPARKMWDEWGISNHEEVLGKQMAYADAQLRKVPMVQGVAWFQFGEQNSDAWKLFNLQGIDFASHYIAALADKPEPEPIPAPVAGISGPSVARVGEDVKLTSTSTGEITGLRWEYLSGDSATGETLALKFDTPGVKAVTLTATGPGGANSYTAFIEVSAAPQPEPEPVPAPSRGFPNLPDWIPFMAGTITGAAIVLITLALA